MHCHYWASFPSSLLFISSPYHACSRLVSGTYVFAVIDVDDCSYGMYVHYYNVYITLPSLFHVIIVDNISVCVSVGIGKVALSYDGERVQWCSSYFVVSPLIMDLIGIKFFVVFFYCIIIGSMCDSMCMYALSSLHLFRHCSPWNLVLPMVNCLLHNQNFTFFLSSLLNCLSVFLSCYHTLILSLLHGNTLTYSKVILPDSQLTSFSRAFASHNLRINIRCNSCHCLFFSFLLQ